MTVKYCKYNTYDQSQVLNTIYKYLVFKSYIFHYRYTKFTLKSNF